MQFLLCTDFSLFPDNHPLGQSFTLSAMDFLNVQPASEKLFVNSSNAEVMLQLPDTGTDVSLPLAVSWARLRVGQFNSPLSIDGFDDTGALVSSHTATVQGFTNLTIRAPRLAELRFRGGGNEAGLVSLCIIAAC